MSAEAKVSVLVPVYNREKLVVRAISSACAQTHRNLEVVVVDNQSSDGTWQVLEGLAERDSRIRIHQWERNLGPLASWQRGLEKCTGDYVKVLWSDDSIEPTFVEETVRRLEEDDEVGLAYTSTIIHLRDRDVPSFHRPERTSASAEEYALATFLREDVPVSPGCSLVRRRDAAFVEIEELDALARDAAQRFGAGPDVLFLLRAAARYPKVAHVPKFLAHFYGDADCFSLDYRDEVAEGYRSTLEYLLHRSDDPFFRGLGRRIGRERLKKKLARVLPRA